METFTMSRKELPRAALIKAALAGRITNRQAADAVQLTVRQIQRLKRRFEAGGAGTSSPWPCRGFSSIRSRPETWLLLLTSDLSAFSGKTGQAARVTSGRPVAVYRPKQRGPHQIECRPSRWRRTSTGKPAQLR